MPALSSKPLSDQELAAYGDLLHELANRTERPLSLEGMDGFVTALIVAPRLITMNEYLPVLVGDAGLNVFKNEAEIQLFSDCFMRRWNEIATALDAPVDNLGDPKALSPFLMDWEDLLNSLPAAQRDEILADGVPGYAEMWAGGFLQVVETWEDDWALPEDSKDEAFVDASLEPFYTLVTTIEDWTAEEHKLSRDDHIATAIWAAYDLREFWRDRGMAPREPIRKAPEPGRNDLCPCGSGKKFKKCCGAGGDTLH
ncbi:MAG: UPF0149 family protein [Thiobacillus sp.]